MTVRYMKIQKEVAKNGNGSKKYKRDSVEAAKESNTAIVYIDGWGEQVLTMALHHLVLVAKEGRFSVRWGRQLRPEQ